jgi:hypothetical protein
MNYYRITVEEVLPAVGERMVDTTISRYVQQVDAIDLQKIIAAVNAKPRAPRVRKAKVTA